MAARTLLAEPCLPGIVETWAILVVNFPRDDHTDASAALAIAELTRETGVDGRSAPPWQRNGEYPSLRLFDVISSRVALSALEMTRLVHLHSSPSSTRTPGGNFFHAGA